MGVAGLLAGGAAVTIVIRAVDSFSGVFNKASGSMKLLGGVLKTGAIGAVAMTAAVAGIGVAAGKSAAKVETGYAKVNTLLDEGENASELFGDSVKNLNVVLGNQGDQLTVLDGLYQTISAGITDTAEAEKFMESATRAAVGGSAQLPTVIEAGTKAIAAFGLTVDDSDRVFDVFAATVKAGQTNMEQLTGSFPRVSGLAGELGLSIEETAGVFAGLTKIMKNPEEAATGLAAVMTGMVKPTDGLKEAVHNLGYENTQAMITELGFMDSLNAIKGQTDGTAEGMGKMFGNVRALRAIFPALGQAADDVATSIEYVGKSAGLSAKQEEDMAKTSEHKLGTAMSTLQNKFTDFGAKILPIFTDKLLPALEPLIDMFTNRILPAIEPIIPLIAEGLVTAINMLLPIFEMLLPHLQTFLELFTELLPKFQPLIDVIMKLVDTGLTLFFEILEAIMPVIEALIPAIVGILEAIMPLIEIVLPPLIFLLGIVADVLAFLIKWIGKFIEFGINYLVGYLKSMGKLWSGIWEGVKSVFTTVWDAITSALDSAINFISGVFDFIGGVAKSFGEIWASIWEGVKSVFFSIWNAIVSGLESFINGIIKLVNGLLKGINAVSGFLGLGTIKLIKEVSFDKLKLTNANDFIITKSGEVVKTNPNDTIIGTKNPGGLGGMNIHIDNVYGLDADTVAYALQDKLSEMINV